MGTSAWDGFTHWLRECLPTSFPESKSNATIIANTAATSGFRLKEILDKGVDFYYQFMKTLKRPIDRGSESRQAGRAEAYPIPDSGGGFVDRAGN